MDETLRHLGEMLSYAEPLVRAVERRENQTIFRYDRYTTRVLEVIAKDPRYLFMPAKEIVGTTVLGKFDPKIASAFMLAFDRVRQGFPPQAMRFTVTTPNGLVFERETRFVDDGERGILGVSRTITKFKKGEHPPLTGARVSNAIVLPFIGNTHFVETR